MPESVNSDRQAGIEPVFPGIPPADFKVVVRVAPALQQRFSLLATK